MTTDKIGDYDLNLFAGASQFKDSEVSTIEEVFSNGNLTNAEVAMPIYLDRGDIIKIVDDTVSEKGEIRVTSFRGTNASNSSKTYLVPWIFFKVWRKGRWIGLKASPAAIVYSKPNKTYQRVTLWKPLDKIGTQKLVVISDQLNALKKGVCLQVADIFDEWNLEVIPEPARKHPAARYMFKEVKSPKDDEE